MAKRKRTASAGQLSIRAFRSLVAKAKSFGLVSRKVDARSQAKTGYMTKLLNRFADVFGGKEAAVKVPRKEARRMKLEGATVKGDRVIVPVMKGEKPRYSRKTKDIQSRINIGGAKYKVSKVTGELTPEKLRALEKKGYMFSVPFKRGSGMSRLTFSTANDLLKLIAEYSDTYPNMMKYVEILAPGSNPDDEEDEE